MTSQYDAQQLMTVAVSLDTSRTAWQTYIENYGLSSWLNFSELKGWKGETIKRYNVYATPTMFLLDKDKKIIAKPENTAQLIQLMNTGNNHKREEEKNMKPGTQNAEQ